LENNIDIIPYTKVDGIRTFKDSYVRSLYDRVLAEGYSNVFRDGSIRDSQEFLISMQRDDCILYVIFYDDKLAAIAWVNRFEQRTARYHFCIFKSIKTEEKIACGTQALKELINQKTTDGSFLFDAFIGYLPSDNKLALSYVLACGAKSAGVVPNLVWNHAIGKSEPGHIIYYVRSRNESL